MVSLTSIILAVVITAANAESTLKQIERINQIQTSWTAGLNELSDKSFEYKKRLCGVLKLESQHTMPVKHVEIVHKIPANFDARKKWPKCPSIDSIKNQGNCGSCWAIGATSAFSDRVCIASNSQIHVNISAEDLMTCCENCVIVGGCSGGFAERAWEYIQHTGVVTGGDYDSKEGCQPYQIPPTSNVITPPCSKQCLNDKYGKPYDKDKFQASFSYLLAPEYVKGMQVEILMNGPIQVSFTVFDDFIHYQKGIYQQTSGSFLGFHGVRVIGWGEEKGTPYWLVANSWGRSWGENGYFRILRGINECSIEENPMAGLPKV